MDYSIDTVARLTGISAFTLRNWEKRYEFLKPKRRVNGFRAYDDAHVEMLRKVSELLRHGARIGDLADSIQKGRSLPEVHQPELAPEIQERSKELYSALIAFDLEQAEALHAELARKFETAQLLDFIYAPLFGQMARDRNSGETTLAQEHFASAFLRLRLAPLLTAPAQSAAAPARKVLCATTSGEFHEGGLMLVTAHLKLRGWSPYYLGANLPIEEIHSAAQRIQPRLVCLAYTDKHGIHASLDRLKQFECKVWISGLGALTYDAEEMLPPHLHLLKHSGYVGADLIDQA